MTQKNPFEIRAEMLQMSKDYMDQQYKMNIQLATDMYDQGLKTRDELQDAYKIYSVKDMMEKAKEMYSFVSKKD